MRFGEKGNRKNYEDVIENPSYIKEVSKKHNIYEQPSMVDRLPKLAISPKHISSFIIV